MAFNRAGFSNLRHAAFTAVPVLFIHFAPPASTYCEE